MPSSRLLCIVPSPRELSWENIEFYRRGTRKTYDVPSLLSDRHCRVPVLRRPARSRDDGGHPRVPRCCFPHSDVGGQRGPQCLCSRLLAKYRQSPIQRGVAFCLLSSTWLCVGSANFIEFLSHVTPSFSLCLVVYIGYLVPSFVRGDMKEEDRVFRSLRRFMIDVVMPSDDVRDVLGNWISP